MTTNPPAPFPVAAGARLLGEVIAWTCSGVAVTHPALVAALRDAGLDDGVARELAPKHAFTRACKKLSDQRIIRQVAEDAATVRFQFTHESRDGDRFAYTLETLLALDKTTGQVTCDLPGLATLAQEHLDHAIDARSGADVTRVIQKLFDRHADLFPVRPQGGVYFMPDRHTGFVDRVQAMLGRINGQILRFPVPAGRPRGTGASRSRWPPGWPPWSTTTARRSPSSGTTPGTRRSSGPRARSG
ncbi:DUF6744 family protein [Fimbriiglobus ruber]|uniref:Uncharacterized protein n=1 Tax=Fimbriiglobus ruber TaxID=1908690 RepID=A0A225D2D6_9BACT|nr:DUF6744 family protein [Fimbriiglobus ruber]OWK34101.1 hypothetical protein FRUB_10072 [Fimbriiglobus ruber]OWK35760.1 hypothetical protein FRUB_08323 [Fimbriiglobus ruber]